MSGDMMLGLRPEVGDAAALVVDIELQV